MSYLQASGRKSRSLRKGSAYLHSTAVNARIKTLLWSMSHEIQAVILLTLLLLSRKQYEVMLDMSVCV